MVATAIATPSSSVSSFHPRQILLIGASTGGTEAIKHVLCQLPDGLPGICVVQHIPPLFSKAFAERLAQCCAFEVREAAHGDEVRRGLALVAPGDYHMALCFEGGRYRVHLDQGPPLHHTRPASHRAANVRPTAETFSPQSKARELFSDDKTTKQLCKQ